MTSCREPLRAGTKSSGIGWGLRQAGTVSSRVLAGPITGYRGLELELSCVCSPDSRPKALSTGKGGLDCGLAMGHGKDPTENL